MSVERIRVKSMTKKMLTKLHVIFHVFLPVCTKTNIRMTANTDFEFSFLEEGFSARDIVEQKINESSLTVCILCWHCLCTQIAPFVMHKCLILFHLAL